MAMTTRAQWPAVSATQCRHSIDRQVIYRFVNDSTGSFDLAVDVAISALYCRLRYTTAVTSSGLVVSFHLPGEVGTSPRVRSVRTSDRIAIKRNVQTE